MQDCQKGPRGHWSPRFTPCPTFKSQIAVSPQVLLCSVTYSKKMFHSFLSTQTWRFPPAQLHHIPAVTHFRFWFCWFGNFSWTSVLLPLLVYDLEPARGVLLRKFTRFSFLFLCLASCLAQSALCSLMPRISPWSRTETCLVELQGLSRTAVISSGGRVTPRMPRSIGIQG